MASLTESTQPFKVRASCGHIDIRRMREATAGVPYTPETILDAPNGRACKECEERAKPIRELGCCCCGNSTKGRQWWNRDTGYGICPSCIEYVRKHGETDAEIRENYGIAGIHYGVEVQHGA